MPERAGQSHKSTV